MQPVSPGVLAITDSEHYLSIKVLHSAGISMSADECLGYFKRGAAALRPFGSPHAYGCPLCLRLFGQDQINDLVLGHAVPKSLRGKLRVLVCWECEHGSNSGHELDAHASKFDLFGSILTGRPYPTVPARLTVQAGCLSTPVGPIRVHLRSDGALNEIIVLPDNPDHVVSQLRAVSRRYADAGMAPPEMHLTLPTLRPVPRRAQISYLRAAYLAAFAVFGYSAIARRSFDRVRAQIREPDVDHDLEAAGTEKIFQEPVSSVGTRPQLNAALDFIREGDVLVVTSSIASLDRQRTS